MSENEKPENTTAASTNQSTVESKELTNFADLVSLCKRRGFIFPSSEIYGGIGSCWDYGPLGVELKLNIKDSWWRAMTDRADVEGLDASILMHPRTWEASGHVEGFVDPLIDCKNCKSRFRADKIDPVKLEKKECPNCGKFGTMTEPRLFNLMFKTHMGPLEDTASVVYLRPETAQGIFVNFENVQQSARQKVPFGIAQIGKAFRNEITPGNFIFRTREFEQMEMQFFVKPGTDMEWFEKWKETRLNWHLSNGLRRSKLRFHQHGPTELAHYARAAFDVEYEYPIGWQEIEGIHNRSDFDLRRHQEFANKKLEYFDEAAKEKYLPFVIETSVGCDRALLALLCDAYRVEGERTVLKLHPKLAPYKVAILPLMKKPDLLEMTDKIFGELKKHFRVTSDESGTIGKRYRRQDEIGTPYCVTIDYDGIAGGEKAGTVTVRERDGMTQERIPAENLVAYIQNKMATWKSE